MPLAAWVRARFARCDVVLAGAADPFESSRVAVLVRCQPSPTSHIRLRACRSPRILGHLAVVLRYPSIGVALFTRRWQRDAVELPGLSPTHRRSGAASDSTRGASRGRSTSSRARAVSASASTRSAKRSRDTAKPSSRSGVRAYGGAPKDGSQSNAKEDQLRRAARPTPQARAAASRKASRERTRAVTAGASKRSRRSRSPRAKTTSSTAGEESGGDHPERATHLPAVAPASNQGAPGPWETSHDRDALATPALRSSTSPRGEPLPAVPEATGARRRPVTTANTKGRSGRRAQSPRKQAARGMRSWVSSEDVEASGGRGRSRDVATASRATRRTNGYARGSRPLTAADMSPRSAKVASLGGVSDEPNQYVGFEELGRWSHISPYSYSSRPTATMPSIVRRRQPHLASNRQMRRWQSDNMELDYFAGRHGSAADLEDDSAGFGLGKAGIVYKGEGDDAARKIQSIVRGQQTRKSLPTILANEDGRRSPGGTTGTDAPTTPTAKPPSLQSSHTSVPGRAATSTASRSGRRSSTKRHKSPARVPSEAPRGGIRAAASRVPRKSATLPQKHRAATTIQAGARGYHARRYVARNKEQLRRQRRAEAAARERARREAEEAAARQAEAERLEAERLATRRVPGARPFAECRDELKRISPESMAELGRLQDPPRAVLALSSALCVVFGEALNWNAASRMLRSPAFKPEAISLTKADVDDERRAIARRIISTNNLLEALAPAARAEARSREGGEEAPSAATTDPTAFIVGHWLAALVTEDDAAAADATSDRAEGAESAEAANADADAAMRAKIEEDDKRKRAATARAQAKKGASAAPPIPSEAAAVPESTEPATAPERAEQNRSTAAPPAEGTQEVPESTDAAAGESEAAEAKRPQVSKQTLLNVADAFGAKVLIKQGAALAVMTARQRFKANLLNAHDIAGDVNTELLEETRQDLGALSADEVEEITSITKPDKALVATAAALCLIIGAKPSWRTVRNMLRNPDVIPALTRLAPKDVKPRNLRVAHMLSMDNKLAGIGADESHPAAVKAIARWCVAITASEDREIPLEEAKKAAAGAGAKTDGSARDEASNGTKVADGADGAAPATDYATDKASEPPRSSVPATDEEQHKAASDIQRVVRGKQARDVFSALLKMSAEGFEDAVHGAQAADGMDMTTRLAAAKLRALRTESTFEEHEDDHALKFARHALVLFCEKASLRSLAANKVPDERTAILTGMVCLALGIAKPSWRAARKLLKSDQFVATCEGRHFLDLTLPSRRIMRELFTMHEFWSKVKDDSNPCLVELVRWCGVLACVPSVVEATRTAMADWDPDTHGRVGVAQRLKRG